MDSDSGRILGEHYRVVEKIGEGGMGTVYKAVDRRLDRTVALKLLAEDALGDDERRKRFVNEAQAASALEHPTIVTIHDMVDTGDAFFIVMQYVEGQTLRDVIHGGKVELATALNYASQLADGLIRAHDAGVIHRDLKPENLMVTNAGQLKILDFGLAKLIEPDPSEEGLTLDRQTLTREGHILGTVYYMSPEQAHGKKIDARSDIFSFGSVFYELVTGWRAFEGKSLVSTIAAITRDEPKPPRHYIASIPVEVEAFIERALQKDPDGRFQSMEELRAALDRLEQKLDAGELTPADRAEQTKQSSTQKLIVALVGAGVVATLALVFVFLRCPAFPTAWESEILTTFEGTERDPALSPDGNQIAFTGNEASSFDLYIMLVSSTSAQPLRLTDTDADDRTPVWSPDGSRIAFSRQEADGYGVFTIPALGGAPRRLTSTRSQFPGLSYSGDGAHLAIVDRVDDGGAHAIFILSTQTGERSQLTSPGDATIGDTHPVYSPDGSDVAFVRDGDVYAVPATGGNPTRLSVGAGGIEGIAWSPDGCHVVYSAASRMRSVRASGGDPMPIEAIAGAAITPTVGPGTQLVYASDGNLTLARPITLQ